MNCCKAIATWNEGENTFVLMQIGDAPNANCPFMLVSDVSDQKVSCEEALKLLLERHANELATEFTPEVEQALLSIQASDRDFAEIVDCGRRRYRPPTIEEEEARGYFNLETHRALRVPSLV